MTTFKLAPHSGKGGVEIVEVWHNDRLVAVLYPESNKPGIRVISKYEKLSGIRDAMTSTIEFKVPPAPVRSPLDDPTGIVEPRETFEKWRGP